MKHLERRHTCSKHPVCPVAGQILITVIIFRQTNKCNNKTKNTTYKQTNKQTMEHLERGHPCCKHAVCPVAGQIAIIIIILIILVMTKLINIHILKQARGVLQCVRCLRELEPPTKIYQCQVSNTTSVKLNS